MLESLQRFVAEKPAFGTCAGCILLARNVSHPPQQSLALMDISVERNAYGRQIDSAIQTGPTKLPGGPLEMVYIRAPRIASVGPGVEVMAERDGFPVLVRQGRLLAATFHPELSSDRRVHQLFVDMVREQRDQSRSRPFSSQRMQRREVTSAASNPSKGMTTEFTATKQISKCSGSRRPNRSNLRMSELSHACYLHPHPC